MKYRIYREISRIEYKDVEADSFEEATKHITDVREDFKITDDGIIKGYWVDKDFDKEKGRNDLV